MGPVCTQFPVSVSSFREAQGGDGTTASFWSAYEDFQKLFLLLLVYYYISNLSSEPIRTNQALTMNIPASAPRGAHSLSVLLVHAVSAIVTRHHHISEQTWC